MWKTWKPRLILAALAGVVVVVGCFDFEGAHTRCIDSDRCEDPTPCVASDPNDQPDDAFTDTNCDGIDGVAAAGLFVDPASGDDANPGTRDRPVKTLRQALELLRGDAGAGITSLYLAQGTYDEDQLVLDRPVSLYGAYGGVAHNWKRRTEYTTFLDGGPIGFTVNGLKGDAGVRVEWVTVASANAASAGAPSVAMRVLNTQDLWLNHATLTAGLGAAGARGADGARGMDGPDGGPGEGAVRNTGGAGGISPTQICRGDNRSGGNGQIGHQYTAGEMGLPGQPSTPGGDGGVVGIMVGSGPYACSGGTGQDGFPGPAGTNGDAGPRGEGIGQVATGMWSPDQQGQPGQPGLSGAGGGGGGSGGGCPYASGMVGDTAKGGGSGGGGGGGCGGSEGQGGGGGGASIALLLSDSTVHFGEVSLITRGGGQGGQGGQGGPGGGGGQGGPGGVGGEINDATYLSKNYSSSGGAGGKGGNGGDGGTGGPGGGGGGGPSVGVWCSNGGVLTAEGANVLQTLGPAGQGGPSSGIPGADGTVIHYQTCNPSPP